jgi:hypothetical protein
MHDRKRVRRQAAGVTFAGTREPQDDADVLMRWMCA